MPDAGLPPIQARHLIACEDVLYDPGRPDAPYSIRGVFASIRPPDDFGYPLTIEIIWLFVQLFGEPGRYLIPTFSDSLC
jgi:hypothetical protein